MVILFTNTKTRIPLNGLSWNLTFHTTTYMHFLAHLDTFSGTNLFLIRHVFSSSLSTTYIRASTSDITTLPIIISNIIFQEAPQFKNYTISSSLLRPALYSFTRLHKFQAWKMKIVTVFRFYFFINAYIVLFLFNNVIYVFFIVMSMYSYCMFRYGYPDWGFSVLFPQL